MKPGIEASLLSLLLALLLMSDTVPVRCLAACVALCAAVAVASSLTVTHAFPRTDAGLAGRLASVLQAHRSHSPRLPPSRTRIVSWLCWNFEPLILATSGLASPHMRSDRKM